MKTVLATMLTYDAAEGRIEPGQEYVLEDDKAERWIRAGMASEPRAKPAPPPPSTPPSGFELPPPPLEEFEEDNDVEEDEEEEPTDEHRAEVRRLFEGGASQRAIAEQLKIPRSAVRRLLAS